MLHAVPVMKLTYNLLRYRRGKVESNDVDIVFTHTDGTKVKGLCKRFVRKLYDRGRYGEHRRHPPRLTIRCNRHGHSRYAYSIFSGIVGRSLMSPFADLAGFHSRDPLRTTHWDSLEKSLTVFILPPASPLHCGIRRRLDLIFTPPEVYWTAVLGWYVALCATWYIYNSILT